MASPRSVPAGNGVTWLTRAFGTLRKHPDTLTGALFLLVLVLLLPIGLQMAAALMLPGTTAGLVLQLVASLAMMLMLALLMVGVLRLIDSLERTGTGSAMSIFSTFRDTDLMARALVFALIVAAVATALVLALLLLLGPEMLSWYRTVVTQPMTAASLPPPITGSPWLTAALGFVGGIVLFGINTFGYAQVALTSTGSVQSFMDGLQGTARNVAPILINMVLVIVTLIGLCIPMVILLAIAGFLGGLVHPLFAAVLAVPLYLVFMLVLYALVFATMYHAWRDVFGDGAPAVPAVPTQFDA